MVNDTNTFRTFFLQILCSDIISLRRGGLEAKSHLTPLSQYSGMLFRIARPSEHLLNFLYSQGNDIRSSTNISECVDETITSKKVECLYG